MISLVRRLARSQRGTSLIEFAIVLPVMVFMLMGLVDVGRYAYYAILAANAARAGVQYGAQNTGTAIDTTGITNAAVADGENLSNWAVTTNHLCSVSGAALTPCSPPNGSSPPSNTIYYVQVQVTGTFNPIVSYPGIPKNVPISGNAVMRVNYQ